MKNTFKVMTTLMAVAILYACSGTKKETDNTGEELAPSYEELQKADWLIGSWQGQSPEGNPSEYWEKTNDSTLQGRGYFVIGPDTVSSEELRLEQRGGKMYYVPTVKTQKNGEPVKFEMTSSSENQLVFENPKHDFPQKITYNLITKDSLLAEISGMMDGKESAQQFPLKRVR